MTYYVNIPSELGYADNTAATDTNTGGVAGNSLGTVTIAGGGSITYQAGRWRFRRGASVATTRFLMNLEASPRYSVDFTYDLVDPISVESRLLMLMTGNTSTYAAHVVLTVAGNIRIFNSANQQVYQSPALPFGRFRVNIAVEYSESGGTDGKIRCYIYAGANVQGTTPDYTFSSDAMTTGSALITNLRIGHANSLDGGHDIYLVNLQADSTTIAALAPLVAGAPVAQVTTSTESYVLIDARTSVSGGGSLSYDITPTTGVQQLVAGWWAVPRGIASVDYTVTVTDGASSIEDSAIVSVAPESASAPVDLTGYTQTVIFNGTSWT